MSKMHLVVTIPAFNEAETISEVISSIPRKIEDVTKVSVVVCDDGSKDGTNELAKKAGADKVIRHEKNQGLAITFEDLIKACISLDADLVVNIDADGQYDAREIGRLIKPVLAKRADMVIGDRQIADLEHMTVAKKYGNVIGSWMIRHLTGSNVHDASSGFRAFNRNCIESFTLFSSHTYTHETIIQAVFKGLTIEEVPIAFYPRKAGDSRLISGLIGHVSKSTLTIIRTIMMYKAVKILVTTGLILMILGLLPGIRFIYFFSQGEGNGHVQSLILSAILVQIGFTTVVMGLISDLISINRRLLERKN